MVKLPFDISSSDRLMLLFALRKEVNLRLSHLAQKINSTIQESSRHVRLLTEAKLVEKNSDGFYTLTSYGKLVLLLPSSFGFLSETRDYFLSLPSTWIYRKDWRAIYVRICSIC
jgi:predicted transcriptional regulator